MLFTQEVRDQIVERVDKAIVVITVAPEGQIDLTRLESVPVPLICDWLRSLAADMAGEEQPVLDRTSDPETD